MSRRLAVLAQAINSGLASSFVSFVENVEKEFRELPCRRGLINRREFPENGSMAFGPE
jgi:hypothetical protein